MTTGPANSPVEQVPRYHFHIEDGLRLSDEDGTELADGAAARKAAAELVGMVLRDDPGSFWEADAWRLVVTNERREILFCLTIAAAVPATPVSYAILTAPNV